MASTYIALPQAASITGPIDVVVSATNDSIRISDGADTLAVNPDGSINVNTSGGIANEYAYDEAVNLAIGGTTAVISQFFAADTRLKKVNCSGTNIGEYVLYFGATVIDKKRTSYTAVNTVMDYETGILIPAGTTVSVEVTNAGSTVGDFNVLLLYALD